MSSYWNAEWLVANSQRSYPLSVNATKVDVTGSFRLPDDVLLSLQFPVHLDSGVEPEKIFLKSIVVYGPGLTLTLGYDDLSSDPPVVATCSVLFSTHQEFKQYRVIGSGDFADSIGVAAFGSFANMSGLDPGVHVFDRSGGLLDPDCVRPMLRGVSSLVVVNGTEKSNPITGMVELIAGYNARLALIQTPGENPVIRFDAISGEGLTNDCDCVTSAPCVQTVGGVPPDNTGNVDFIGDACVDITTRDHSVVFSNSCSVPCCGCEELAEITRVMTSTQSKSNELSQYMIGLNSSAIQTMSAILGSQTRPGCGS